VRVPWNRGSAQISLVLATAGSVGPPSNTQSIRAAARLAIGRDHFTISARNLCSRGLLALLLLALATPAFAEVPLTARSVDKEGWWKGRAYGRASGSLRELTGRVASLGVDGILIQPLQLDEQGAVLDHQADNPDLAALIEAAHAANVAVLVAFPLNHVSAKHPWFVAAESGDRLAQDAFVWSDTAKDGEHWTESAKVGRWYYHAKDGPDLDLRHRSTRARVMQAALTWIERGADGLVLEDVRDLFEDGPGQLRDRPENVALVHELSEAVRARGAVIGVDVDGDAAVAARYLRGAMFAIHEGGNATAPAGTRLARWVRDEAMLLEGDPVFVDLAGPDLSKALAARRRSAALSWGVLVPLGPPAFARQLGRDRVVVARAPALLDLKGVTVETLLGADPVASGSKLALSAPGAWRVIDAMPASLTVRFGHGHTPARDLYVDLGLRFDEARGIGFSRDIEGSMRCSGKRCALGDDGPPLRWHMSLPPGAYEVEVDGKAPLLAEGQAMEEKKKTMKATVFVRDGQLTLEARDPGVSWSEIKVSRAKSRAQVPAVAAAKDRVTLRMDAPGVVEWRMNGSRVEPVEQAPLVRKGLAWEATLGPWPPGAVRDIAWVVKGADGTFVTGEGGRELTLSIP